MTKTLELAALEVLRACLDLAAVDVRPTLDLLGRLLALDADCVLRHTGALRRAGLLQGDRLALTMPGLAIAAGLPALEPRPIRAPTPRALAA